MIRFFPNITLNINGYAIHALSIKDYLDEREIPFYTLKYFVVENDKKHLISLEDIKKSEAFLAYDDNKNTHIVYMHKNEEQWIYYVEKIYIQTKNDTDLEEDV